MEPHPRNSLDVFQNILHLSPVGERDRESLPEYVLAADIESVPVEPRQHFHNFLECSLVEALAVMGPSRGHILIYRIGDLTVTGSDVIFCILPGFETAVERQMVFYQHGAFIQMDAYIFVGICLEIEFRTQHLDIQ